MGEFWNRALISFQDGASLTVGLLVSAVVVLLLGLGISAWVARLVGKRMLRWKLTPDTAFVLQRVTFVALVIITVMTALSLLKVPITAFTFMSGAIAIGVGFGAQNIINNFISGWILMSERPVRIGDFIEIDGSMGTVERVGNRSTQIRRVDGVHIMVPNSVLIERTLVNWTLVDPNVRTSLSVGVAYGSPVRQVEQLFRRAVEEHPQILRTPEPVVLFNDFGDSALVFEAFFWCSVTGERELRRVRSDLRYRIDELFREHDITIAFPQRDLHLKTTVPIDVRIPPDGR